MSILVLCVCAITSFFLIGTGLYGLKRGFSVFATKGNLWRHIVRWRVFDDAPPSAQIVAEIERSWCYLHAIAALGGGIGGILLVLGLLGGSLATTGVVDENILVTNTLFLGGSFYCSVFIGMSLGGMFAIWRMRARAKRSVSYGDLRQRRLSDYRSNFFPWMPIMMIVGTVALSWFFFPHLGTVLRMPASISVRDVPKSLWLLGIVPAMMVVTMLIAEFFMSRLARLSRLLITAEPKISQRADDMLRATAIGMMQTLELFTMWSFAQFQITLVIGSLWASGYWQLGNRPYEAVYVLFLFLLLLALVIGSVLSATYGGLGGKISGWPWQRQVKHSGAEQ
jgi:hypothetical protein